MSEDFTENETAETMSLEEILTELNQPFSGKLPVEALRAAQARREEITPYLIKFIQDAANAAREGNRHKDGEKGRGHFFALFLLTEFQAKEAFPVILDAMCLPGDLSYEFYSDALFETMPATLAVLGADQVDLVAAAIDDETIASNLRWTIAGAYIHFVKNGSLTREEAVERLRRHLANALENEDWELASGLIVELTDYSPHEAKAEIEAAFQMDLVDFSVIDQEIVNESLDRGEEGFRSHLEDLGPSGIADTVDELSRWWYYEEESLDEEEDDWDDGFERRDSFDPRYFGPSYDSEPPPPIEAVGTIRNTEPRIGRNEPCPCGSGKKYKKCCGKP